MRRALIRFLAKWRRWRALEDEAQTQAIIRQELHAQMVQLGTWRQGSAFYRAWFDRLALPLPAAPAQIANWEDADAGAVRAFLASTTGEKLVAHFRNYEAELLSAAVCSDQTGEDLTRAAGFAAGFRGSFAYWIQLSVIHPPHPVETATTSDQTGDEDAREHSSPE